MTHQRVGAPQEPTHRAPPPTPSPRPAIPGLKTWRELRYTLARGGLGKPTAEDSARVAGYRVVEELLRFYEELCRRVQAGEPARIVEVRQVSERGHLRLEFAIEGRVEFVIEERS